MKLLTDEEINNAITALKDNEIIILPTDTIYGISAVYSEANEKLINNIKNSPESKPLIILISSLEQAEAFVDITKEFKKYIFDPEPITVISKKTDSDKTFALRLVKRQDIKMIIDAVGPIFSTSVNHSGKHFLEEKNDFFTFSEAIKHVFFTEKLTANPSKILNLWDFSKKRWQL